MTSIFGFTSKTDGVDDHLAAHVNALQLASDVLAGGVSGVMYNGQIVASVGGGALTVAIKTLAGANPSASDPVIFRLGNTLRMLTAALSVTRSGSSSNWFTSGGTELATQEVDYFAYIIWNTGPATDILDLGFARVPYANIVSDTVATVTAQDYLARSNATTPTASDDVAVIGRFNAILSASPYVWSLPATTVVVNRPVFETRTLAYVPLWASSGTQPAIVDGTMVGQYKVRGREVRSRGRMTAGASTTFGTGTYNWSTVFTSATFTNGSHAGVCRVFDNSATTNYIGVANIASGLGITALFTHAAASAVGATVPVTLAASDHITWAVEFAIV